MRCTSKTFLVSGFFLLLVCLSPGRITSADAGVRLVLSRQMWKHFSVLVPQQKAVEMSFVASKNAYTSKYGIAQSLAFVPFDMLGWALAASVGSHDGRIETLPIVFLYAPLLGLLWFICVGKLLNQFGFARGASERATLLFFVSTILIVYSAQTIQEEALVGCTILGTFLIFSWWVRSKSKSSAFWLGVFIFAPFLIRLNAVFAGIPVAGFAIDCWRGNRFNLKEIKASAFWTLLGSLIAIGIYALFAYLRFGNLFQTGFALLAADQYWRPVTLEVAWKLLFGIGKGLFVLSPPLILCCIGFFSLVKKYPFFGVSIFLSLIASALFHSRLGGFADGSEAWGTRYQVHLLSFLVLPTMLGFRELVKMGKFQKRFAVGLVVLGILIQISSTLAPDSLEYAQVYSPNVPSTEALLLGKKGGQLLGRARNAIGWISNRSLASGSEIQYAPGIRGLQESYMPNIWGPVYAKKTSFGIASMAFLALWGSVLITALALLLLGINAGFIRKVRRITLPHRGLQKNHSLYCPR